jgi:glucosamine kinase
MILIADSGSTKCDWMLLNGGQTVLECPTMGFNPYFHDAGTITGALRARADLMEYASGVEQVFFYGAGASSPELKAIVRTGLKEVFRNAKVHVGHDLDAAALATYSGVPHVACILGTGSNSCFFDGAAIYEEVPALAYILGDEGGGSYYGKRLLADFFYKRMPVHLAAQFGVRYNMNMKTMVEKVYTEPNANVYLASLSKFCSDYRKEPYILEMIREGMRKFLDIHVTCYANHKLVPVDFVGSIAYYFEDELRSVASEMGITVGVVVKKPIHGLVKYHQQFTLSKVN